MYHQKLTFIEARNLPAVSYDEVDEFNANSESDAESSAAPDSKSSDAPDSELGINEADSESNDIEERRRNEW